MPNGFLRSEYINFLPSGILRIYNFNLFGEKTIVL